ncbi:hypothetical protein [Streptomyces spongiae]|uniref:Uncharacterized protein n=1 Tax=Streptomyces spongiae TaxID=565072 RepID=A0A5N8Y034_9ACTN|nr:hypothetical protein [Streptomyces spongiae]MPY64768.1 hypothetical protein [Streptomyces spongiae]
MSPLSPQAQSAAMWALAVGVNTATVCAGLLWGWDAFVQFLLPAVGSVVGASLVSYSRRS